MAKRDEMELMRLGYPKGMGSAKFLPPPDRDFIRAYHLTSAEHGISGISLSRLKVARFSEVNDPFELMALNSHNREIRRLLRRFKVSQNSKTGLLCFSGNWTNPLLWSHYANKHKGICLGFDLRQKRSPEGSLRRETPTDRVGHGRRSVLDSHGSSRSLAPNEIYRLGIRARAQEICRPVQNETRKWAVFLAL